MLILPLLRTVSRGFRGDLPRLDDLDQIIAALRRRRERGLPVGLPRLNLGQPTGNGERARSSLQRFQTRRLQATIAYVYRYSPYYRALMDARHLTPADITGLVDLAKLPITQRQDLEANFESFLSQAPGVYPTMRARTGGTTGKPLWPYLTYREVQLGGSLAAIAGLLSGEMGPRQVVQMHFSLDTALEAHTLHIACQKTGTLLLNWGWLGTLRDHAESIFQERQVAGNKTRVSSLLIGPAHLWALTRQVESLGLDFRQAGLRSITTGGSLVSEDLKARVRDTWGVRLTEGYGMADVPTFMAGQCPRGDVLHALDLTTYLEVLDPASRQPVPPGRPGVLVLTSFYPYRECMPVLRYWTNDLVIMAPPGRCSCGSTGSTILDIVGRADQMLTVGTTNFYPQAVGDSLLAFPELALPPRFAVSSRESIDGVRVHVAAELASPLSAEEVERLRVRVVDGLVFGRFWQVTLGAVHLDLELCPPGSIARPFPYKARGL
jgi:phenylacetate-CoA ligase